MPNEIVALRPGRRRPAVPLHAGLRRRRRRRSLRLPPGRERPRSARRRRRPDRPASALAPVALAALWPHAQLGPLRRRAGARAASAASARRASTSARPRTATSCSSPTGSRSTPTWSPSATRRRVAARALRLRRRPAGDRAAQLADGRDATRCGCAWRRSTAPSRAFAHGRHDRRSCPARPAARAGAVPASGAPSCRCRRDAGAGARPSSMGDAAGVVLPRDTVRVAAGGPALALSDLALGVGRRQRRRGCRRRRHRVLLTPFGIVPEGSEVGALLRGQRRGPGATRVRAPDRGVPDEGRSGGAGAPAGRALGVRRAGGRPVIRARRTLQLARSQAGALHARGARARDRGRVDDVRRREFRVLKRGNSRRQAPDCSSRAEVRLHLAVHQLPELDQAERVRLERAVGVV